VIQDIAGGPVKGIYATFWAIWGVKSPRVFLTDGCLPGSSWQVDFEKQSIRWACWKHLAQRTSFRDNSLLPYYICFLKMCVAMPPFGIVSRWLPSAFRIVSTRCFFFDALFWISFDRCFFSTLPAYPRLNSILYWDISTIFVVQKV
jgi:hypothetical protein